MMKRLLLFIAVVVLLVLGWRLLSRTPHPTESSPAVLTQLKTQNPKPKTGTATASARASERSTLADALNAPGSDIQRDLQLVLEITETFRSNFPQTGNPVGNNAEITAALTGKNKLGLSLIPADHPAINRAGELCDRWGTPFFFHAESGTRMEVRSAGPDRKLWSEDDVVLAQ